LEKAVEQAKSFDVDKVVAELEKGIEFDGPGGKVTSQKNHHLTKNVFIGENEGRRQFKILKEYKNVVGEPFLKGTFKASTAAK
jgi:urea transport system substrate-binding protein